MIRSAYIAPTEQPTHLTDVKRALLTYDRVYVPDPGDRDLIPPQSFMLALGMPPLFGMNMGAVRPLGKSAQYDSDFDRLLDEVKLARVDGCVEVVSTYDLSSSAQATIGAVMMGDYPLNPQFMLWAYRSVARDQGVLEAAIDGDRSLIALADDQIVEMSIAQASADGGINDDLAHSEYMDDAVLANMSVGDVLKLRNAVWGKQAEARDGLLSTAAELAREAVGQDDYDKAVLERIRSYRTVAEELQKQRSSLSFKINCELLKGAGGGATSLMAGTAATGILTQLQTAMGAGTVLLAGCLWAIGKIQDLKPAADQLRSAEAEFKDNACFGMHNFYRRVGAAVSSSNIH